VCGALDSSIGPVVVEDLVVDLGHGRWCRVAHVSRLGLGRHWPARDSKEAPGRRRQVHVVPLLDQQA